MKITHVRISVLESGPGYNNRSCTLEAIVEDDENWQDVATELTGMCKQHIHGTKEVDRLWERVNEAQDRLANIEREVDRKSQEVEANRKIIREHDRLVAICHREGIDPGALDGLPF